MPRARKEPLPRVAVAPVATLRLDADSTRRGCRRSSASAAACADLPAFAVAIG